jgi:hypothetical protein
MACGQPVYINPESGHRRTPDYSESTRRYNKALDMSEEE